VRPCLLAACVLARVVEALCGACAGGAGVLFAMKVLRKDNVVKRKQVEHTNTERRVLGYTKHPFIVGLHYAFQTRENLYFVLDYCAGGELFFHLGRLGRFRYAAARVVCLLLVPM
jgi:serine/threonine protein kinase